MRNNNQKVIRKLSARSMKKNRMRNLFAIGAICLTSLLFTAVFSMGIGMGQVFQEQTMMEVGGKFHAGLKHVTREQYEKITDNPLVKSSTYNIYISMADNVRQRQAEIRVASGEGELDQSFARLKEGRLPEKEEELVADTIVLEALGISPELGEKVPLEFEFMGQKVKQEFTLCGWYEGNEISYASELYVSQGYYEKLSQGYTEQDFVENYRQTGNICGLISGNIFFADSRNIEENIKEIIREAGYVPQGEAGENTDPDQVIEYGTNWAYLTSRTENLDPETLILLAGAFLVILITGYLIIYNIFQLSILKEIRFYGLLKTVGTTKKQLKNLVYRQVWKLSAVGIPLGLVLGFLAGQLLIPFLTRVSGYEGNGEIYFSPWIFVFGALFSLATVFISCRKPARIAGKVSPIEAVRYTEGGVKRRRKKKGQKGGRISRMALANLGRNKKKTLIVVLSLSFSIILLEVVMTGVGSFRMDQYLEARLVGDYMIGNANFTRASPITSDFSIDETYLAGADSQPGILETGELWTDLGIRHTLSETGRQRYEKLYEEGKMDTEYESIREAALRAIDGKGRINEDRYAYSDSLLSKLKAVAGTIDLEKFATGDYVLVQQFDSEGNDRASIYKPGDRITLSYPTENSEQIMETDDKGEVTDWYYTNTKEKEYQVMAVIEPLPNSMNIHRFSANALTVVVPLEDVKASANGILFAKSYRVQEEDQPAFDSYLENYTQQVNSSMGYLSKDSLETEFSGMVNAVAAVGYSLCAVIAIIGLLNFANSMLTGILSRNQELAAMQSIGMTKGQIRKMLLWESGYYILISGVVSIVLGSVGAYYLVSALNNVVVCFQYRYTPWPFILMIPLCAVIAAGISLAAYQQTQRKSVVERLRESE